MKFFKDENPQQIGVYTVHDCVADLSGPVFCAKNDYVAMRNTATMLLHDVDTPYYEDFELRCVGWFNPEKCILSAIKYRKIDFMEYLNKILDKRIENTRITEIKEVENV